MSFCPSTPKLSMDPVQANAGATVNALMKLVSARCGKCRAVSTQQMAQSAWDAAAGGKSLLAGSCPSCRADGHLGVDQSIRMGIDAAFWAQS